MRSTRMISLASRRLIQTAARAKISLIGAGQIGSILGILSGLKHFGDVHFFDIMDGVAAGKALDLNQLAAIESLSTHYYGSSGYENLKDSSVTIVTAGVPRKPGMSRKDLIEINAKIIINVSDAIRKYCPEAFVICITNPLDAMVQLLQEKSQLPKNKVVGMAGVLDSARFIHFLSEKLEVSPENVQTLVFGGHADTMVPMIRYTSVAGIPLPEMINMGLITQTDIDAIILRTRYGGQEIVNLLKSGSAFFTPAACALQMAEAYLLNKKKILPCAAYLNGEYNVKGYYAGVPVVIGENGVEKVIQVAFTSEEQELFKKSVEEVKKLINTLKSMNFM